MKTYKFDWKDTVTGTIEIEASSAKEADEKFKNMPSEELYKQSQWNSNGKNRCIRFVEIEGNHDILNNNEWKNSYGEFEEWNEAYGWMFT